MWRQDPNWNEPKPKRHNGIRCFTCKKMVPTKALAAAQHKGHEVHYVGKDGAIDE